MKKRLLILMMFLVAIATGSWAEVVSYNLWVAGTQVNSSNATDVLGDGTVSYDASNGTLTLNNASITTACDEFIRSGYWGTRTGIRANQDLTIVLTGSNTIDLSALTYNRVMRHSIFVNGNLTIKGTGSLVARSGAATNNNSSDYRESTAIHAEGTLTFDGDVTVEAVGGTSECDSAGLRGASGGVVVKGNASVVSEGSAVTVKSRTSLGAWCNVTVQGGSFVGFGKISACGTLTVPTGYYIYAGDDEASATLQSGTSYSGSNAKYVKATGTAVHTHTAGDVTLENQEDPTCTTDGHYDEVVYCTICGEEMSRETQYIPALGHDLTLVPEVPATTTSDGTKEHYTCSRCTDLLDKNYATVSASDLVIPMLVEPEAYAALSDGNKTLTFYYDGQKTARNGMSVGPFTDDYQRGWDNQRETITTVVFDASFANYKPTSTALWFYYLSHLTTITGIENLKTDEVTDMYEMFDNCSSMTSLDLSSFNTEKVTNMSSMFYECLSLTSLDVSSFNTANVTYMGSMFEDCSNLTSLDLSSFNTANVVSMYGMFRGCSSLTSLDLSSFNTANVTYMGKMFLLCQSLKTIYVDSEKWNMSKVADSYSMFYGCTNLVGGNGTVYDENHTDVAYAVVDKDGTPGYLTDVKDLTVPKAYAALSDDNKTLTFYYDFDKATRKGMSVGPFTSNSDRGWKLYEGITTVVFDASFADYRPTSTAYWFNYLPNLTTITGIENLKTDEVTDMHSMFYNCRSMTTLDLSSFNTEKVTNMHSMFYECLSLTSLDVSSFNTANVTNMYRMFGYCSSLTSLDLSGFNTEKVTNMYEMFICCRGLESLDLSSFNTENVESMFEMFFECSSLTSLDLSSFNTANVTNMNAMIYRCTALTKITVDPEKWNTSKVSSSYNMFANSTSLVGGNGTAYDANHTDVAYAVIDKDGTPGYLTDVNVPVEPEAYAALSNDNKTLTFYYDGQKASRNGMSVGPFEYSSDVGWDNQKTTTITTVVFDASFANYRPTSTVYWFYGCNKLTTFTGIENLKTDDLTSMYCMFAGCSSLTSLDLSGFNTEKVTDMSYMFGNCYSLTNLDLSSFNTANVEYMGFMFGNCYSLTSLDLSSFNTANVTNMAAMFRGCSGLTSLDLSIFNTANVKFTYEMFYGCSSLTSLDLSSFNTANVQSTDNMFSGCTALTKITVDPDKWDTSKVTYSEEMFKGCTNLVGGNGTAYDENHTDVAYAVIDKDGTPGYLTDVNVPTEPEAYAVLSSDGKTLTFYYDMEKASRGGMSVGPFDGNETLPAWSDKASGIRNANIDESFAGYTALTSTAYWFEGCSEIKAVSGMENLVMDNVTDMSSMFKGCNNLRSVSLSGMNTGKVTNMHALFWDCNALQTIDLSTLDTRSVTDMSGMFNYCNSLKTVDLSGVNTASVTDMNNMFYYCSSLTDLDLSSFNTASVTNMRYMFEGCSSLTKITVSETGWTTKAVNSGTAMFSGCRDIVGGNGTTYDAGHTDEGYARIDKAGTPGYLTSSAGTGINLLKTTPGGDGYFYTPDGRRIEGQPTKQGFYITNGRKVMAK